MNYFQCKMQKGNTTTVSWIPEKHSVLNHIVKLKQDNGTWDDGWKVIEVGSLPVEEKAALDRERDYTKQRDASDI